MEADEAVSRDPMQNFADMLNAASAMYGRSRGWQTRDVEADIAKRRCMGCFNLLAYCACRTEAEVRGLEDFPVMYGGGGQVIEVQEHRDRPELLPAPEHSTDAPLPRPHCPECGSMRRDWIPTDMDGDPCPDPWHNEPDAP
jgi:hypothetical protein